MDATWTSAHGKCAGVVLLLASLSALVETSGAAQQSSAVLELQPLEAGITLPVQVDRTLSAGKVKAGTVFFVTTTQRIPVSASAYLNRGAKVRGEVVTSEAGDGTAEHPSVLTIRFTELSYRDKTVPVETRAIAAAHFMHVSYTLLPTSGGGDNGNASQASWNTRQVGGHEVNRSGWVGDVSDHMMQKVGYADYHGVYSLPVSLNGGMVPRAMGVFSTTAKGLYGYDAESHMKSSGGLITITNPKEPAVIRNQDQLLLEVVSSR